jgi:hypothetical protein
MAHQLKITQFNGKPILQFWDDPPKAGRETPHFAMGLSKLTSILDHVDEIRAFVASGGASIGASGQIGAVAPEQPEVPPQE